MVGARTGAALLVLVHPSTLRVWTVLDLCTLRSNDTIEKKKKKKRKKNQMGEGGSQALGKMKMVGFPKVGRGKRL